VWSACVGRDVDTFSSLSILSMFSFASRIQCHIKSLGPFKGRVSTLATHLRGLLVST
jgi:hypothetical protein